MLVKKHFVYYEGDDILIKPEEMRKQEIEYTTNNPVTIFRQLVNEHGQCRGRAVRENKTGEILTFGWCFTKQQGSVTLDTWCDLDNITAFPDRLLAALSLYPHYV